MFGYLSVGGLFGRSGKRKESKPSKGELKVRRYAGASLATGGFSGGVIFGLGAFLAPPLIFLSMTSFCLMVFGGIAANEANKKIEKIPQIAASAG